MSFSVGIVGLPNAGKSTLFKALTKKKVDIATYPFTTIDPNVGTVAVPDKRLKEISSLVQPEKTLETVIEFVDIAGLVKNAHKGEGMGNQFLAQIKAADAIVEVIRDFKDANVEGKVDPESDIGTIENEFLMKDLETLDKLKPEISEEIKESLFSKKPIEGYQFLSNKPRIYLFNIKGEGKDLHIDLKIEEEMSELSQDEKEELNIKSKLDQLILACYNILDLITFFTIKGGKEAKAWTLKRGSTALDAAEKVHTDFKENFKKAEAIDWQDFINSGSWLRAKELGKIRTVSKDYIVSDGDVIEFKI